MVDKLRAIVIGCGNMGTKRARSLMESSEAELQFAVDQDRVCAEKIASKYDVGFGTDPYEAMDRIKPDFVFVSTPNKFHAPIAIAALKKGIHVVCEKPLARNPTEAKAMVRAGLDSQAFLKTGSNLRFFPSVLKAKELLDNGAIGDLSFARGWIGNNGWHLQQSWNSWFSDPDLAGGGTLLDNGAHMFDLVRWFLGEILECQGAKSILGGQVRPVEDTGFCIFRSVSGKIAFVQSSWLEWAGYMYMEIYGSEGYVRIDNRENACATTLGRKDGEKIVFDYSLQPPVSYALELDHFIDSLKHSRQPLPSGYDGLRAVEMAYGTYESAEKGRRVVIYGEEQMKLQRSELVLKQK